MLIAPAVAAVGLTLSTPAVAAQAAPQLTTGAKYLVYCTSQDPIYALTCISYTQGLAAGTAAGETAAVIANGIEQPKRLFCLTRDLTNNEIRDMMVSYLQSRPERRSYSAASIYIDALRRSYPC